MVILDRQMSLLKRICGEDLAQCSFHATAGPYNYQLVVGRVTFAPPGEQRAGDEVLPGSQSNATRHTTITI